jgi:hypothetical protein
MRTTEEERLAYESYLRAKRDRIMAGAKDKLEWIETIMVELNKEVVK